MFKTYFYNWSSIEKDTWLPYFLQVWFLFLFLNGLSSILAAPHMIEIEPQYWDLFAGSFLILTEYWTNKKSIQQINKDAIIEKF